MRTSISKKLLAGALSVMMVLSLFAGVPANKAQAASYSLKQKDGLTKMYSGSTYTYNVTGVKKGQYVKISRNYTSTKVTAKENGKTKTLKAGKKGSLKLDGTGKKLSFSVKLAAKNIIYTNKVTVKVYSKAGKVVKTLTKSAKVYKKTTAVELDKTEATLKIGETVTLTATKTPAKCTRSITWATSDASVATVEGGVVTAVAAGTATITAKSGSKTATANITVEAKEAELVELKATGSKELTATLSATAEITAKDIVVKKGNVTLTPADVKVDGTSLVITLGSKITKDTYSVTYKEKTVSVETEDEKLVEFKTVGTAFAQMKDADVDAIVGANTVDGGAPDATTVNAAIEYQAKNQYGENIAAEVLSVTSTFGGKVYKTEPTAKKNGTIIVYDIAAALGIAGTKGNLIIVSKTGVSNTCEVVMSEEAKVAKINLKGIWSKTGNKYIDAIPAQTDVTNYALVIEAFDQYERPISNLDMLEQTVSMAKVLTNVQVAGVAANKLVKDDSFETLEINDKDEIALKLEAEPAGKTVAGTLQLIIVGDRFGSVMNETIKVEQVDLIKSFSFSNAGTLYNHYDNELEFTATTASGKEVKDYATLKKLVTFGVGDPLAWSKNTDGTATLVYTPAHSFTDANNLKENTVLSVTAYCNKDISAGDQIVVPRTFTVYEDKVAYSIVKYTGDVVTTGSALTIKRSKLVIEDQYGNTMTSADGTNLTNAAIDYQYDAAPVTNDDGSNIENLPVTTTSTKLYLSIAPYARANKEANVNTFNKDKAQLTLSLQKVDDKKATSITAEWALYNDVAGYEGSTYYIPVEVLPVNPQQATSDVEEGMFELTGKVNGKAITINPANYSIKKDTYVPITAAEAETAVKTATVTFSVVLTDDAGDEYTEEVSCDYQYSAAPEKITGFASYKTLTFGGTPTVTASTVDAAELGKLFVAYDQYGDPITSTPTFEISLGDGTDDWTVTNNNTDHPVIADIAGTGVVSVIATLKNGMTATQTVKVKAAAAVTVSSITVVDSSSASADNTAALASTDIAANGSYDFATNGKLLVTKSNGTKELIAITAGMITNVSGEGYSKSGTAVVANADPAASATVTFTYEGKTTTVTLNKSV